MDFIPEISLPGVASLGARIVGVTFVWTAVIKAIAPRNFHQHLASLGLIPDRLLWAAVTLAAAFEAGWGVGLMTGLAPQVMLPATIALLAGFSAISWWGVHSGKAPDCGCYGGYIQPSITQSLGLNALFAVLVMAAWLTHDGDTAVSVVRLALAAVGAIAVGSLTELARRYPASHGRELFDLNPIKVGRRWRHSWAGGATSGAGDEVLVAYLGPDCPYCKSFVTIANAMVQSPKLPRVVGVVASSRERLDEFILEKGIRFPVTIVSQSLMRRIAQAVPTAVLVKSGRIERTWVGDIPADFVDRFRRAFFPDAKVDARAVTPSESGAAVAGAGK